jgi:ankyrin repeat protein
MAPKIQKYCRPSEKELRRFQDALLKSKMSVVRSYLKRDWVQEMLHDEGEENLLNYCGSAQAAKLLLDAGANVNFGPNHWTPLLANADFGREDVVRLLLKSGADPNLAYSKRRDPQIPFGTTPLMKAAGHGHLGIVKCLICAGASLNARDERGHNALFRALYWDRTAVAKYLLRQGSALTPDALGGPVYHGNTELVRMLIAHGADVNCTLHRDEGGTHLFEGETLLGCAVRSACMAGSQRSFTYPRNIIPLLLQAGSDPNQPTLMGARRSDPISIAANWGDEGIFKILKKGGAQKSLKEAFAAGWTIHGAAFAGRTAVVKLLLKAGFPVNEPDKDGKTPIQYASERGHADIVRLLREGVRGQGRGQAWVFQTHKNGVNPQAWVKPQP